MNAWRLFAGAGLAAGALMTTTGCGEKPQGPGSTRVKTSDTKASDGTVAPAYAAAGWKAGDAASWEAQLKARTMNGQNEYTRTATK
jgi:hypothetical protein